MFLMRKSNDPSDLEWLRTMVLEKGMLKYGLKPDHFDYNALLYCLGVHGHILEAEDLLPTMSKAGVPPNNHTYNILFGMYKRNGLIAKALQRLLEMDQPPVECYNQTLIMLVDKRMYDQAMDLFLRMPVQPDNYTYVVMLQLATKTKQAHFGKPLIGKLLNHPKFSNYELSSVLCFYTAVLMDLDTAMKLLKDNQHFADVYSITAMVGGLLQMNEPAKAVDLCQKAFGMFPQMKPNEDFYRLAIAASLNARRFDVALDNLNKLPAKFANPETIVSVLANLGAALCDSMPMDEMESLLDGYDKTKQSDHHIHRLLAWFEHPPIPIPQVAYNGFLLEISRRGRVDLAKWTFERIFGTGAIYTPNMATYSQLTVAYVIANRLEDAMAIYYVLRDRHPKQVVLDSVYFNMLIKALAQPVQVQRLSSSNTGRSMKHKERLSMSLQLFTDMRNLRLQPSPHTYTILLNACSFARDADGLLKIHQLMKMDLQLDPTTKLYNALMDGYNRTFQFEQVMFVWDKLFHDNKFDNASVSIVLDACGYHQQHGRGEAIWKILSAYSGFSLNTNNFNSYIEFICRSATGVTPLQRWLQAYKVTMLMQGHCHPDAKTLLTLDSFATKLDIDTLPEVKSCLASLERGVKT
ncbi:hypothetical protein DM01DRAFT_1406504 [Hesseltinella vesiculosa]|uniref:TPR-like protein n=1 Tax=Hesseltinella vesiculosa TaxID=101127 RepID=A0A1X2GKI9_9FUNG|nr:hypothetical protein DM01DRAFT_1406504 [Hesseltinella vesiculosa]